MTEASVERAEVDQIIQLFNEQPLGTTWATVMEWLRGEIMRLLATREREARRQEREENCRVSCERCRTTPHFVAFDCETHRTFCHESGVDGWGHYACGAGAIRARAQAEEGKNAR